MNRGERQSGEPLKVWYVEGRGPAALGQLRVLAQVLQAQAACQRTELQVSPTQPELALLVSWWPGEPAQVPLAEGLRAWTFEVLPTDTNRHK